MFILYLEQAAVLFTKRCILVVKEWSIYNVLGFAKNGHVNIKKKNTELFIHSLVSCFRISTKAYGTDKTFCKYETTMTAEYKIENQYTIYITMN